MCKHEINKLFLNSFKLDIKRKICIKLNSSYFMEILQVDPKRPYLR